MLAVLLLKLPVSHAVFHWLTGLVHALQAASESGTGFVFGYLGGGPLPFEETQPGASFVLAFRALPLILVVSALSALLFYWRVLPLVVSALSWLLQKSLGVGGAVGLGAAAHVFVGMVEAPLLIRPFMARLSRGELFAVMTCGMATVAGTVLALYGAILGPVLPDALGHLLIASILSVPAAITVARLMVPDPAPPTPAALDAATCRAGASSAMDAVTRGTLDGVRLLINVIAMLIVLVALVHLCNQLLTLLPEVAGADLTLERAFGWAFALLAWLMGLPPDEALTGGALIGTKIVLNERIAYLDLAALPDGDLYQRVIIMTHRDGLSELSVRSQYRRDVGHHTMLATRPESSERPPFRSLLGPVGASASLDDAPASPAACFLPDRSQKRSLWVIIITLWY